MAMHVGNGKGGYNSEINVTPLVDVVLVLLIIFMVVVPLAQRGYDVALPREVSSTLPVESEDKPVILGINLSECPASEVAPTSPRGCRVRLNQESVPVEELPDRIGELFRNRRPTDRVVFLAAEEQLSYETVIRIVDAARSGVDALRIGLVTDEKLARPRVWTSPTPNRLSR